MQDEHDAGKQTSSRVFLGAQKKITTGSDDDGNWSILNQREGDVVVFRQTVTSCVCFLLFEHLCDYIQTPNVVYQ